MRKPFTQTERDLLVSDGWEVSDSSAHKNYHRIVKDGPLCWVETLMIADDDRNDYWEWDSGWHTVERALQYCKNRD
jgi:hypothetical protein